MRFKKSYPYLFLSFLLISITAIIMAEQKKYGAIGGIITDGANQPVVSCQIAIEGTSYVTLTGKDGKFAINSIPVGKYNLLIKHADYIDVKIQAVVINSYQVTDVSYQLTEKKTKSDPADSSQTDNNLPNEPQVITEEFDSGPIEANEIPQPKTESKDKLSLRGMTGYTSCAPPSQSQYYPPAHGGNAIVNGEAYDAMFFKSYGVNPFVDTEDDHLSTFAIDVDDASFVMTRSYLNDGNLPPDEAVRVEEFINHFKYNYYNPNDKPFSINFEGAPSIFGQNSTLIKIGIQGKTIEAENRKDANLIFVIDISGSMGREDRLGLVRKALRLLVDELTYKDKVGIVVYGSYGKILLEPTSLHHKDKIISCIESLAPGGSTNAEEGLLLGYKMANRYFEKGKINRIILCSDGVANVGRTGPDDILKEIKKYADQGITLSAVGFGMGNYNDVLMEKLGNKGNGHYAYVDNLAEAKKIFVDNLTGNLQVIAKDVKIQVDFDPEVVRSYRLIGYENRDVDDDKFRDDKEDGGEIGAGHQVTALYEIKFNKSYEGDNIGTIYVRYKNPDNDEVDEVSMVLKSNDINQSFDKASYDFKLAASAAEFAEILRESYWAKGSKLIDVQNIVASLVEEYSSDDVIELLNLVSKARQYEDMLSQK